MRHAMKLGASYPLLALFGGTRHRSYVDVEPDTVTFRFGTFEARIPRPLFRGIGWRIGPGAVALIGSLQNVVEVRLRRPHRVRVLGIPVMARRVSVSLEQPAAFLSGLGTTA